MHDRGEHRLEHEQWVPRPPDAVFQFFADAHNLEAITPPFLHFRVLGTSTAVLGDGTRIDYRLRLHGIPVRWQSVIEEWRPPHHFVDRQVHGPYALWHHTHELRPQGGGTLLRDVVRYRLPFGRLGQLVAGRLVAADLERIFDYRRRRIEEIFAGAEPAAV
jgi:ligand-binding SRPBCC domain-containing protein